MKNPVKGIHRYAKWFVVAILISLLLVASLVWYVAYSSGKDTRDAHMRSEVQWGCLYLKRFLEARHKSGEQVPLGATLADAIREDPFMAERSSGLVFYDRTEFGVERLAFSSDGTFVGVLTVSSVAEQSSQLPRWEIDYSKNADPDMYDEFAVRRIP